MIHFHPLTLTQITDETSEAYTLVFNPGSEAAFASYKPGQYLTLRLTIAGEEIRRSYSLSSSPATDKHLSVTIKRVAGGKASNFLRDTLKAGDTVAVMPPMGNFAITPNAANRNHYVLIGAGSGITPLFSMLKTVLATEPNSRVSLWYGSRSQSQIIFADALSALQRQYPDRLEVIHVLSRPEAGWNGETGRLDAERLTKLAHSLLMQGDNRYKQYFMCGPQAMMTAAQTALEKEGVNAADIHHEYYTAPVPTEAELEAKYATKPAAGPVSTTPVNATVKIILDGDEETVQLKTPQTILDAGIKARLGVPYSCQSGICTACRGKLLKGQVVMDSNDALSQEEIEEGYILTCQSHPTTPEVEVSYDE